MIEPNKKPIPDYLLPEKYRGKGYTITDDCKAYGLIGTQLIPQESPTGLGHPIILNRNLWYMYAVMYIPNPDGLKHVVQKDDGEVVWITYDIYRKMCGVWNPRARKLPFSHEFKTKIAAAYQECLDIDEVAQKLDISKVSAWRHKDYK